MNVNSLYKAIEEHETENGSRPKTIMMDLKQWKELLYSCQEAGMIRGWELDDFEGIPITIFGDNNRTLDMRGK